MRIEIPAAYAARLRRLAHAAGLSSARWVKAAIRAAEEDASVAGRIAESAPASEHGGKRPGAGRPPGSRNRDQDPQDAPPANEGEPPS